MASIAGLNRVAPSARSETAAQPADVEGTDESSAAEKAGRAQVGPLAAEVPANAFPAAAAMMNQSTTAQVGKVMGDDPEIADGEPPTTSSTVDPPQESSGPSESNMGRGAPAPPPGILSPTPSASRRHNAHGEWLELSRHPPTRAPARLSASSGLSFHLRTYVPPFAPRCLWRCVHAA